jgi:hypothetical protein
VASAEEREVVAREFIDERALGARLFFRGERTITLCYFAFARRLALGLRLAAELGVHSRVCAHRRAAPRGEQNQQHGS